MASERSNNNSEPAVSQEYSSALPSPEQTSLLPSRLTFFWFDKFVWQGRGNRPLDKAALYDLDDDLKSRELSTSFEAAWDKQGEDKKESASDYRLFWCLLQRFKRFFVLSGFCHIFAELSLQMTPKAMQILLQIIARKEIGHAGPYDTVYGYLACLTMFLLLCMKNILGNQGYFVAFRTGIKIRSSLTSSVFCHLLEMSIGAKQVFPVAAMVMSYFFRCIR